MKRIPIGKPFVHDQLYFYYDTYTNKLLNVTKEHFKEINKLLSMGVDDYCSGNDINDFHNDIIRLINRGFFNSQFLTTKKLLDSELYPSILSRCVNQMQLQTTRMCNFRCRYCFFANDNKVTRNHENINMDWETARKSIDFLYDNSKDAERIIISFYGGEPFINFNLIRKTVDYAESKFVSKELRFSVTTNGSIMNDSIADFLAANNFSLLISLDGPKNVQNDHRKFSVSGQGTFDAVLKNVMLLKQRHEEYFNRRVMFNPVMFADESYSDVIHFFESIGVKPDHVQKRYANMRGIDYSYNIVDSHFFKMPEYERYQEYNADQIDNIEKVFTQHMITPAENLPEGGCIPGLVKLFVSVDGDFYPCEKVNENDSLSIGDVDHGFNFKQVARLANLSNLTYNKCKECWAVRFCNMCILQCTDADTGNISSQARNSFCDITRKISMSYLKRQAEKYSKSKT